MGVPFQTQNPMGISAGAGAAISAGAGLLGNIVGGIGRRRRERRAEERAIRFWNMQNEYNSPKAQMQRLKDAGLNPNLIYGGSTQGATGQAGSIDNVKPDDYDFQNPLSELGRFQDFSKNVVQTNNARLQSENIAANTIASLAKTAGQLSKNKTLAAEASVAKDLFNTQVDAIKASINLTNQKVLREELDNYYKDASMVNRIEQSLQDLQLTKNRIKNVIQSIKESGQRINESKSRVELQNLEKQYKEQENELMRNGVSKNDPWYARMLVQYGEDLRRLAPGNDDKRDSFLTYFIKSIFD